MPTTAFTKWHAVKEKYADGTKGWGIVTDDNVDNIVERLTKDQAIEITLAHNIAVTILTSKIKVDSI